MTERTIQIISPDDFVCCPQCGIRACLEATEPCDQDEDGPIFEAMCQDHGEFLWQVQEDEEGEDD